MDLLALSTPGGTSPGGQFRFAGQTRMNGLDCTTRYLYVSVTACLVIKANPPFSNDVTRISRDASRTAPPPLLFTRGARATISSLLAALQQAYLDVSRGI
jgi:hypothetical protein